MGLKEVQKELKDQLDEALKADGVDDVSQQTIEKTEESPIEVKEEIVKEEKESEEKPAEEAKEEKPTKTAKEYAEERRAAKAAKIEAENARLNAALADERAKAVRPVSDEPNKADDPQAWTEWKLHQTEAKLAKVVDVTEKQERERAVQNLRNAALDEVQGYEAEVRAAYPDYDQAKSYYANMLAASMQNLNPDISNAELVQQVNDRMLGRASELLNKGHENPIAAMREEALKWGFKPAEAQSVEEKVLKPDLAKVAANRARNAGTAGANGKGGQGEMTPQFAATITNQEWSRMTPTQKKAIMDQLPR